MSRATPPPPKPASVPPPPPPKPPDAKRNDIFLLYRALVKGELESVEDFLERDPYAIFANISAKGEKPIHIAVSHGHQELVELLLKRGDATRLRFGDATRLRLEVLQDDCKDTALHLAASGGKEGIAKVLVKANNSLLLPKNEDKHIPLTLAAIYGNKGILEFLCGQLNTNENNNQHEDFLFSQFFGDIFASRIMLMEFIKSENYDLALKLWKWREDSAKEVRGYLKENLHKIAKTIFVISSENQLGYFKSWMYRCMDMQQVNGHTKCDVENPPKDSRSSRPSRFKVLQIVKGLMSKVAKVTGNPVIVEEILKMKIKNKQARELLTKMCSPVWTFDSDFFKVYFEAIEVATKCGNVKFVEEVLRSNPTLLWGDKKSGSIFHIAVASRQEKIWNLIYGLTTEQKNKIAGTLVNSNSMLHIAAYPLVVVDEASKEQAGEQQLRKVFNKAPGAAMKLQRELQWYKEVERMVPSSYRFLANKNGETPPELFTKWHSELIKEGEKWMRDTATSCTIVAALIVTVMFAAAFTSPGGTDEVFLGRNSVLVFVISDALSLFSSVTAVLMFLSILTSRFEQENFLMSLPNKLIIGLTALFISIASMMVAFGVTLVMVLGDRISWFVAAATITLFGSFTATLFASLQLPLFVDIVSSTYGCGFFNRKTKCSFFNNPNDYVPPKLKS